jgi:nifR3 family TIM-barrel protein
MGEVAELLGRGRLLAPMAGVSDPVFRGICEGLGADLTYTEMVSAKGLAYGSERTEGLLSLGGDGRAVGVQLFGREAEVLAEQARRLESRYAGGIALIDVNMGCPARKVAGKGEGAALMREPAVAERILRAVVRSVSLPVTVKFRKGYELGEDVAVEFARMAESCGVAAVAVHGRTARQLYHGQSDREVVGRVVRAVTVPVIASGDVFAQEDIREYRERYGAAAVMVARGARGNPWIFAADGCGEPSLEERARVAREHAAGLARLAPQRLASMRRHVSWYFKGTRHAAAIRRAAHDCICLQDYEALLEQILAWR